MNEGADLPLTPTVSPQRGRGSVSAPRSIDASMSDPEVRRDCSTPAERGGGTIREMKTLAILVGGGPAPGINGVIAAATIEARNHGLRVLGLYDGYKWLVRGDTAHVREHFVSPPRENVLVSVDVRQSDRVEIINRRAEPNRGHNRRRSRFELRRQISRLERVRFHATDHTAAAEKRWHGIEQRAPTP